MTEDDTLYALGAATRPAVAHEQPRTSSPRSTEALRWLSASGKRRGRAIVLGYDDPTVLATLGEASELVVDALVNTSDETLHTVRRQLDERGSYGTRVAVRSSRGAALELPPYIAELLVASENATTEALDAGILRKMLESLRPFGGVAIFGGDDATHARVAERIRPNPEFEATRIDGFCVVRRPGRLPGSTDYLGGFAESRDRLVRAPLGVLWFDDAVGHFKRSPQPVFVDGVMVSRPKDWLTGRTKKNRRGGYSLLPPTFSDVYTGRTFLPEEVASVAARVPPDNNAQPSQYRPPTQKNAWKPEPPRPGERTNPLTGRREPRTFPKSYGCDGGIDYGLIYTMRSGTAAFYDKITDSGTISISGPRSGCTNSVIPAAGLLNVPYFYEGCTCSYPLPVGLALVRKPESHEQWTAWGTPSKDAVQGIVRIGLNLGAPGDRRTEDGTLWLDVPSVGGPSPRLDLRFEPAALGAEGRGVVYRHSLRMMGGEGWPWVAGSGVEGIDSLTLRGLQPGPRYTVRLTFSEPDDDASKRRVQSVSVQGRPLAQNLDIRDRAGGPFRGLVLEANDVGVGDDGALVVSLTAREGTTILCGVEIIREESSSRSR